MGFEQLPPTFRIAGAVDASHVEFGRRVQSKPVRPRRMWIPRSCDVPDMARANSSLCASHSSQRWLLNLQLGKLESMVGLDVLVGVAIAEPS